MGVPSRRARVGVDLVRTADVAASIDRFGDRYLNRLFTAGELADSTGASHVRARSLAGRFAAKEAAVKAMRLPDGPGDWRWIEVRRGAGGWTDLVLHAAVRSHAEQGGIDDLAVSISHEEDVALAVVTCTAAEAEETK